MIRNEKIKVVQLVPQLPTGGAESLVKDYAIMLDDNKFDTTVIVNNRKMDTANEIQLEEAGKKIVYLYRNFEFSLISRAFWKVFGRHGYLRTYRALKKEKPDVIHIHLSLFNRFSSGRAANDYAKRNNAKIFFTIHTDAKKIFGKKTKHKSRQEYLHKNKNIRLIALHDAMKSELNEFFSVDNTVTILNGINMERFKNPGKSKAEIRSEIGIMQQAFVIGHVGRMIPVKNHIFIIKIFNEALLRNPDTHLFLIGDGGLEKNVLAQIEELNLQDKVTILKNRKDVNELIHAMDVFVLPSLFEGIPVTLIEAQASGLKCVVSDRIYEEAFVTDKVFPLNIDESPEKWCDIILDDTIKGTYSNRLNDYDMKNVIKKLEKLYLGELD